MFIMLIFILPITLNFIAVYFLYNHWKNKNGNKLTFRISLALSLISLISWLIISGPEFGTVYWACCSALFSWVIILHHRKSNQSSHKHSFQKRKNTNNNEAAITRDSLSLTSLAKRVSSYTKSISKLLFVIIIPFIFSASISFLLPLVSQNFSSNMLMFSLGLFLIIWPLSILECYKFINRPKRLMLFSSLSICMLLSVVGTKLV